GRCRQPSEAQLSRRRGSARPRGGRPRWVSDGLGRVDARDGRNDHTNGASSRGEGIIVRWIGLRVGLERAEPRTGEDCRAGPLQLGRGQLITSSCRFRRPANGAGLGRWAAAMPALLLALSGGGSGPKGAHAAEAPARVAARLIWDG